MYLRAVHREEDLATLHAFIKDNPLGVFTTAIESSDCPFLQSSHIPFVLDLPSSPPSSSPGPSSASGPNSLLSSLSSFFSTSETKGGEEPGKDLGVLRGHIARANPQSEAIIESLSTQSSPQVLGREVLILFNSPHQHYITPSFYTASEGRIAPTWNYIAVEVHGTVTIYHESPSTSLSTDHFLNKQLSDLARLGEREMMGHGEQGSGKEWKMEDAPSSYIEALKKKIVGIEIKITRIGGKWKMSQELKEGDREGVIAGFQEMSTEEGKAIAEQVRLRDPTRRREEGT